MLLDLQRTDQFQCCLERLVFALVELFGQDFSRLCHTTVTDMCPISRNEHQCFILANPTKGAVYIFVTFTHLFIYFLSSVSVPHQSCRIPLPHWHASNSRDQMIFFPIDGFVRNVRR